MTRYRWSHPLEWLDEKLDTLPPAEVLSWAKQLAQQLDGDQIQDLFQQDMDDDGYFTELDE